MKVRNWTDYDGRAVRSIAIAVRDSLKKTLAKPLHKWPKLTLYVLYEDDRFPAADEAQFRLQSATQYALTLYVPKTLPVGDRVVLRLKGKNPTEPPPIRLVGFRIFRGLMHVHNLPVPNTITRDTFQGLETRFGALLEPTPKVVKKLAGKELQQKRYESLLARKKQWQRKLKLAETKLKGIAQKERYYKKALGV